MDYEAADQEQARVATRLTLLRRNLAVQDVVVVGYHGYMLLRALAAGRSAPAADARALFSILFAVTGATVLLVRADLLPAGRPRAALYRLALVCSLPASYTGLGSLFQALEPTLLDSKLWAIDRALLGTTPAIWLARFNEATINEWFSFFYQSYYLLLAAILILPTLLDHGRRLEEAIFGVGLVAMVGHTLYTLVPGAGPHATLMFAEPIRGGFWWSVVAETVRAEGVLDIFPSVHTAIPVFFTLHALRHRRHPVMRWVWLPLAAVASQIIVATMLLRWHWAIDIVAGVALAVAAFVLVAATSRFEQRRRERDGSQPVWEPLFAWQTSSRRSASDRG